LPKRFGWPQLNDEEHLLVVVVVAAAAAVDRLGFEKEKWL
jgi:hypothetical protein